MKKVLFISIIILEMSRFILFAQDSLCNGKALNIPSGKFGLSIGNSHEFNGIRINFADKNVKRINGLNLTFWFKKFQNEDAIVNGISIGIIPTAGKMQPINLGVFGVGTAKYNLNGLSIGGIGVGSGGNINGISLSGLIIAADGDSSKISGITISGLGLGAAKALNGLAIGGLMINSGGDINGFALSLAYIHCEQVFKGIGFAPYIESGKFKGISTSVYSKTSQMNGISFGFLNRTKELHGIQFGLWNHVGNNPKCLRNLPIVNFHLGKKQSMN